MNIKLSPAIRLEREDVPAWYILSLDGVDICITIHKTSFDSVEYFLRARHPFISSLAKRFSAFIPPDKPVWGFGPVLKWEECEEPGWVKLRIALPTKENKKFNYKKLCAVSATLLVLFEVLGAVQEETDAKFPQMLHISGLRCEDRIWGGAISASVSPAFCKWINSAFQCDREEFEIVEPSEAMVAVEKHMWNNTGENAEPGEMFSNTRAWVRKPKFVFLDCTGNACGLGRSLNDEREPSLDIGYSLEPHNTDTPIQQLTLLAGLARLYEMALRK